MFTFHEKDKPLYDSIKKIFNAGCFYKIKLTKAYRYTITDKDSLIKIIHLVNGKFRTPKIMFLHRAIDNINTRYNTNIIKLPLNNENLLTNA